MYTQVELDPPIRRMIEAYEGEHGIEVAVLDGRASLAFEGAAEFTDRYPLVVVSWAGRDCPRYGDARYTWPGELFANGLDPDLHVAERPESDDGYVVGGMPVAQIEPGVIYYHVPLHNFGIWHDTYSPPNQEALIDTPFGMALDPDYVAAFNHERLDRELERFRRYHADAPERRLREVREKVYEHERFLQRLQSNLADTIRALREERVKAEIIEAQFASEDANERAAEEWGRLKSHPRIRDVRFRGDDLVIVTDHVTLSHPDGDYEALMGSFKITHNLEGGCVTYENLDSPRNNRPHPHVDEGGLPCYGELAGTVERLLRDAQYIALFELELEFLESYNPEDDWGRHARRWIEMPFVPTEAVPA